MKLSEIIDDTFMIYIWYMIYDTYMVYIHIYEIWLCVWYMIDDAYISHLDNVDVLQAWHFLLTQEVPVNIFEGKFQDHRGLVKEGPYRLSRATLSYHLGKHDES